MLSPVMAPRLLPGALAAVAVLAIAPAAATATPFTANTILVEKISGTATNVSQAIGVYEYTKSGSFVQAIDFPSSNANQQTDVGSSASNGYLNTYAGLVSVPGLNLPATTSSANSSNTKVNSILDTSGTVVSRVLFPTGGAAGSPPSPFSGSNYRSSIATSGSTFYAAGTSSGNPNTGGVWYYDGSAFVRVSSTASGQPTNVRNVEIYGD